MTYRRYTVCNYGSEPVPLDYLVRKDSDLKQVFLKDGGINPEVKRWIGVEIGRRGIIFSVEGDEENLNQYVQTVEKMLEVKLVA